MNYRDTLNRQMLSRYGLEKCASIMQLADNPQELEKQARIGGIMGLLGKLKGAGGALGSLALKPVTLYGKALVNRPVLTTGGTVLGYQGLTSDTANQFYSWVGDVARQGRIAAGKLGDVWDAASKELEEGKAAEVLEKRIRRVMEDFGLDREGAMAYLEDIKRRHSKNAPAQESPQGAAQEAGDTANATPTRTAEEVLGPLDNTPVPTYSEEFARDPLGHSRPNYGSLLWRQ